MQEKTRESVIKHLHAHSLLLIRRCALRNNKSCLIKIDQEIKASALKLQELVETNNYLNRRVPDVLSNAVVRYGVRLVKLSAFSDLFLPEDGTYYTALFYEVYGSDVLKYLDSIGRQVVLYKGYPFDKIEVGNRLDIPWSLIDELEDNSIRQLVIDSYLVGVVGNKSLSELLGSGVGIESRITKKQSDHFEAILKKFNKEKPKSKVDKDIEASSKKPKAFSAAQAKSSYSWSDTFKI